MPSQDGARHPERPGEATSSGTEALVAHPDSPPVVDGMARRLLDAGRRSFVEHGYHGANVADISKQAGTSVGLLYYHFSSKLGLYRAVWADYQQRQWQHTHHAVKLLRSVGVDDGRVLFLAGTRAYMNHLWENRDLVNLVHNQDTPPGFVSERRVRIEAWLSMNAKLLKLPDERSTRVLVEMTLGALTGAVETIARLPTQDEADNVIDVAMQIFGHMLAFGPENQND